MGTSFQTETSSSTGTSQPFDKARGQLHKGEVYRAVRAEKKIISLEMELLQARNELTQARDKIVDLETTIELKDRQLRAALEHQDRPRTATKARSDTIAVAKSQQKRPTVDDQGFTLAAKGRSAPTNRGVAQQSIVEQSESDKRLALLDELPFSISRNADDKSPSAAKAALPALIPAAPLYPASARPLEDPSLSMFIDSPVSSFVPKHSATMAKAAAVRPLGRGMDLFYEEVRRIKALKSKKRIEDAATSKLVESKKEHTPMGLENITKMLGGRSRGTWADSDESGEHEQGKGQGSGTLSNENRPMGAVPSSSASQVLPARVIDAEASQHNSIALAIPAVGGSLAAIPAPPRSVAPTPGTTILGKRSFEDENMYIPQSSHGNKSKKKSNGQMFTVRS